MNDEPKKELSNEAKAALVRSLYDAADDLWEAQTNKDAASVTKILSIALYKEHIALENPEDDPEFSKVLDTAISYIASKIDPGTGNDPRE